MLLEMTAAAFSLLNQTASVLTPGYSFAELILVLRKPLNILCLHAHTHTHTKLWALVRSFGLRSSPLPFLGVEGQKFEK